MPLFIGGWLWQVWTPDDKLYGTYVTWMAAMYASLWYWKGKGGAK